MQKLIQFSQKGVYETLYQTSFGNTAMRSSSTAGLIVFTVWQRLDSKAD